MKLENKEDNIIKLDNCSIKKQKHSGSSKGLFHKQLFDQTFSKSLTTIAIILSIIAILLVTISSVVLISGVDAATVYVATNGTDSASGDSSAPKLTLKNATGSAASGDTILLKNGTYKGLNNNTNLTISKNLTIAGEAYGKVIIDAERKSRHFQISAGYSVTIINITFINANVIGRGGAILNSANVSVSNSSFIGNTASGGGAISNVGNCSVSNSIFSGNDASISGIGGINPNSGGGAISNEGNLNVINSSFSGHNATTGGAIGNGGNCSVSNSSFSGNNANNGGAIHNSGNCSVSNSSFIGNTGRTRGGNFASSTGGAIGNGGGNLNVSNSIFTNNTVNDTYAYGGAIHSSPGNVSVSNSSFSGNNASHVGGAIYIGYDSNFSVSNSSFSGNNANNGGAIYQHGARFSLNNSSFSGNNANNGGAIYGGYGYLNVSDSSFIGNDANGTIFIDAINCNLKGSIFSNNTHMAIYTLNNQTSINNNSFNGNDGVLGIGFNNSNIDLNSYLMSNNTMKNNDIVLLVDGHGNNISNGSIIGNSNSIGILVNGHNNTLSNITIANLKVGLSFNTTNSDNILTNATISGNGIGMSMLGSNDTVISSNIVNNTIVGINVTGDNNIVQYNRIHNNTLGLNNSGTYTDVNFNWWGLNNITGQYTNTGADFNLHTWYVLELSLNNTFYTTANDTRNYSKNQSANLSYNLSLNIPVTNTPNLLPYFEVTILIKNSTTIVNNLTGDIRNTSLSQSVAINNPNTQYSINALSDDENLILTIVGEAANYTVNVNVLKVANVSGDIHFGDNVTYTITITNNEILNNATGVFVEDLINYNKVQYLNSNTSKGTYNYGTGIWDIGTLEAGETVTLTVNVTITGTGILNNTAIVATDENNTNNNTTSTVILNITDVDISIVKIANTTGTVSIGDNITYIINVTNNGENTGTGIYVTDILDTNKIKFINATASIGTYNNTTGKWTIGNLLPGQSATLTINITIIGNNSVTNTANITTDQKNINNQNQSTITNNISKDVNITLIKVSNTTGTANIGDTIKYTITITNKGLTNATGVYVTDKLNTTMLGFASSNVSKGSYNSGTGIWAVGNLNPGETVTLTIIATIISSGTITNVANVTSNQNNTDDNNGTDNNTINVTNNTNVTNNVNLSVVKVSNVTGIANVGDTITYTITVANNGNVNATNVIVTDKLNTTMLRFINSNASKGQYNNTTGLWTIGNLNSGETATLNIIATIINDGTITNVANVTSDQNNTNTDNGTGNATINVTNYVNVSVVKVSNVTGIVNIGDNITYTITVTNHGSTNATGVFVTDKLNNTMLSFVSSSANRGNYDNNTGIWTIGSLGAGETVVLNITTTIIGSGRLTNIANVITDQNNTDNGTTNSTINVKYGTNLSASIPDAKIGDTVNITLNLTDSDSNPVSTVANVTVDGVVYPNVEFINGIAKVPYIITEVKNNISIGFKGNDFYGPSNVTIGVNFTKVAVNLSGTVPAGKIGDIVNVTLNLTDVNGNPVNTTSNVTVDGVNYTNVKFVDGIAKVPYNVTGVKNNITVVFEGNNKYGSANDTASVNFTKTDVNLSVSVPKGSVGDTVNVTLNLTDVNGNPVNTTANLTIDGVNYTNVKFVDGIAKVPYNITAVKSNITVEFSGDDKYSSSNLTVNVNFSKKDVNITIHVPDTKIGHNTTATINLTDAKGNPLSNASVKIILNGKALGNFITDKNGQIHHVIPVSKDNVLEVKFSESNEFNAAEEIIRFKGNSSNNNTNNTNETININVHIPPAKAGDKVVATITATDSNGNPIPNIPLEVVLNGKVLGIFITDKNGQIHPVIQIKDYNVLKIKFNGFGQFNSKIVEFKFNSSNNDNNNNTNDNNTNNNNTNNSHEIIGSNVSMKKTGVPLINVILLILGIFGLISANKLRNKSSSKNNHGNSNTNNNSNNSNNINNNSKNSIFKIAIIISLIAILFVSVSSVSAVNVTISTTNSTGINGAVALTTTTGTNHTITLNPGTYNKTNDIRSNITSNVNLTIQGNGPTNSVIIDARKLGRMFIINSARSNVTFINLTFINGNVTDNGGAIDNFNSIQLTIVNCNFTGNVANVNGGAIYSSGGTNFSVINSIFTGNNANVSHGGAICNFNGTNSNFSVINSSFNGNSARNGGGAISNYDVNFSVINSIFTGNNASVHGGAIQNTGVNSSVINSSFNGNSAPNYGGAINNGGDNFNVINSIFTGNNASSGGVIYNTGVNFSVNSTFTNNNATTGGVIYNAGSGGNFSVNGSIFTGNNASNGSVIYNTGGNFSVSDSIFTGNDASNSGVIYNNRSSNFSVSDSIFTGNTASLYGGAIYNAGADNFSVISCTFTGNTASLFGGAVYTTGVNFSVSDSIFTGNNGSGAIYNLGVNFSVSDSIFTGNNVSYGGAIYNCGGNFSAISCTFTGNNASRDGGAIFFNTGDNSSVINSSFTDNIASRGGAIYNTGYVTNLSVINSSFICNNGSSGGAIYNTFSSSNFSVFNSSFVGNNASYGGAIYNEGGNFSVSGSIFTGNNASSYGGVMYNTGGNFSVNNSTFTNNNATTNGGVMYNAGSGVNFSVNGSIFTSNNAKNDIICNFGDNFTVYDSTFSNNTHMAIYTLNNQTSINNNSFNGNDGVLGIGFNNSTINLNTYLISNNIITNNGIVLLVDGHRNNISNGSIIGNNNTRGIFVNGHNNTFSNITIAKLKVGLTFNSSNDNNVFTNGTLDGNEVGAVMYGLNDTIISTTIVNNTVAGINVTGHNNTLNYNRIYQNAVGMNNSGTNTNVNFNWWGKNNINDQYTTSGANLNLSYWYVLQLSLNSTFNTTVNATRNYTKNTPATLSYRLTLNNLTTNDSSLLPYFTVEILLRNSTNTVNTSTGDIRTLTFAQATMLNNTNPQSSINALADDENIVLILDADPLVNLSIVKVANATNVLNNDTINFTITVTNNGTDFASNVTFTDLLNNGFKLLNWTGGSYNNTTGVWIVGDIAGKTSVTLHMIVQAIKSGTINNTAGNVTAIETLENPNINSTVTINVTPAVNLNITKISNVTGFDTSHIGDHVNYTITVKNNGLDIATNVTVYDILNSKITYFNYASSTGTYDNNTGLWNVGTLNINQTATLKIEVIIASSGTIENIVNVTAKEIILNGSNTNASTTFYVGEVNVSIIKVSNASANPHYGDHVKYTITVENHGPIDTTNVTVTDYLDKNKLIYIDHTAPDYTTYDIITGLWNIGNLEAGLAVLLTIEVEVTGFGNITNTANLTTAETNINNQTNSTAEFNVSDVNVTIIKVSNTSGHNHVGDNITYTITVMNKGSTNASNVTVFDLLDSVKLHYLNSNVTIGSYNATTGVWIIGNLEANTTATLLINVTLIAEGNIFNKANLTTNEPNINNKTNVSTEIVVGDVNVSIIKVSNITSGIGHYGDKVTYTITVTNNGLLDATVVTVNETLDNTKLKFINYTSSDNSVYDNSTGLWDIGTVYFNTTVTLTLYTEIIGLGLINNTVNLTTLENNLNNQTNSTVLINVEDVNLTIIKSSNVTGEAHIGDNATYIITVSNNGITNATNVTVNDLLDTRKLKFINAVPSIGSYNVTTGIWTIGNLKANTTVTLSINVTIIAEGNIFNTANVTTDGININNKTNGTVEIMVGDINISIIKISNITTETAHLGDNVTYTIAVSNNGETDAINITVNELIDNTKLKFTGYITSDGSIYDNSTGIWTIRLLNHNTTVTLILNATIITMGTITNTANITTEQNNTNNQTNTSVTINVIDVDVTIIKVANLTENIHVGDNITYIINVTNNGPTNASNVTVTDNLDHTKLHYINASSTIGNYDESTGHWTIENLAANTTATLTINVTIIGIGKITNTANITTGETNINNQTNSTVNITVDDVNISIIKVSNITSNAHLGDIVNYTITVTNLGSTNATGIYVIDQLDFTKMEYVNYNSTNGTEYIVNNGTWIIGNLKANNTVTLTILVKIIEIGTITNTANVTTTESNINSQNNSTVEFTVNDVDVNLTILKVSNATKNQHIGDYIKYNITVINNGKNNATNFNITESLDKKLKLINYTTNIGTYSPSSGKWQIANLDNNTIAILTIQVQIIDIGTITNTAALEINENNIGNNNSTVIINVNNNSSSNNINITINKIANQTKAKSGEYITYTITVINQGTNTATGVKVNEVLDLRLKYISSSGYGSYNPNNGVWNINTLKAGEAVNSLQL
ncbi:DUF7507 domain-containing protein [Methanobrevibacter filiformis]|uniref:Large cysteine-rich periplasmic protein OmcB n=1 Tax=Methanobrevibacter filiformis TaxID=55758 RepID=A0A162FCT8_9EURY|nr:DUF11 domain-containing protein [Methanobrevibacter filiformis]KZX11125.1 large cysteine-rich periplasmic protein OmcB precursor [Methanobrevibacter filiformis]